MADKHQYGFEQAVTVTPDEAWQVYAGMEKPSYAGCASILAEQGHKVSLKTIDKWGKRYEWQRRLALAQAAVKLSPNSKDIFAVLKLKAEWMDPTTLKGLQASVAERMAVEIEHLPIATTEDIERVVGVLDRFDAIIHRHRGAAIGSDGDSPISLEAFRTYQQDKKGSDPTSA